MDLAEFRRTRLPAAKRSRLEPFREQILELRLGGYAYWQIREWLDLNGLRVSRQAVSQFIYKIAESEPGKESAAPPAALTTTPHTEGDDQSINGDVEGQSPLERDRARRERKAARFVRESNNTVLNILQEKKP